MKKLLQIIGFIISFLLSIVLFFTMIFTIYLLSMRTITSTDNINKIIKNTDFTKVEDDLIKDVLVNFNIEEENQKKVLESKEFKDILGNILGSSIESNLKDNVNFIDKEKIKKLLNKNWDGLTKELGVELNKEELENLKGLIVDNSDEINKLIEPTFKEIKNNNIIGSAIDITFNSNYLKYAILAIVLLILLIALFRYSFISMFNTVGIVSIFVGFIYILLGIFVKIFNYNELENAFITSLFKSLKGNLSLIFIIYGIAIMLISISCFKISKYINEKKKEEKGFLANTTVIDIEKINK
ncbi:MAG: hypothetical protein PHU94_02115 [Bacilli bacterium]|nr:hypothetical protein [Bacilli bacterium]MDD4733575.1 hypothetical protein [Bacilli bacterium]